MEKVNLNLLYSITGTQRYIRIFLSFDFPMIKTMLTGYLMKSIKSVVPVSTKSNHWGNFTIIVLQVYITSVYLLHKFGAITWNILFFILRTKQTPRKEMYIFRKVLYVLVWLCMPTFAIKESYIHVQCSHLHTHLTSHIYRWNLAPYGNCH